MLDLMALLPCCHVKESRIYLFGDVVALCFCSDNILFSNTVKVKISLISYSRYHVDFYLIIS